MPSTAALRLALRLNAGFSTASSLALIAAHRELGALMGVEPSWLIATGIGLALFAVQLVYTSSHTDPGRLRAESLRHSCADFAWVVASIVVIAGGWLTPIGNALLGAVAVPVLALGIAQFRGLPEKPPKSGTAAA